MAPAEVVPKGLAKVKAELRILGLPMLTFTAQEAGETSLHLY